MVPILEVPIYERLDVISQISGIANSRVLIYVAFGGNTPSGKEAIGGMQY
jgi:hypothetical protein